MRDLSLYDGLKAASIAEVKNSISARARERLESRLQATAYIDCLELAKLDGIVRTSADGRWRLVRGDEAESDILVRQFVSQLHADFGGRSFLSFLLEWSLRAEQTTEALSRAGVAGGRANELPRDRGMLTLTTQTAISTPFYVLAPTSGGSALHACAGGADLRHSFKLISTHALPFPSPIL